MKVHKSVSLSMAAVGAVAAVVLVPGTADASSGGGCHTQSSGMGKLESCISASGAYLEPDGYLLVVADNCETTYIELEDVTTGDVVLRDSVGCWPGHYGPFAYKGTNGHKYATIVVTYSSSSQLAISWSPVETLSY
ncbi:hypothetical protein [Streptomyces sp. cg40]|uniref:hypothetical protein n=1 Tax=Streptomyces sp. cg40 TaxID=3419764 RepID=UPI003D03EFF6